MIKSREERLRSLLLNEIASKSIPAAVSFSLFAILAFFYHFNLVRLRVPLQVACIGVILASIIRVYVARNLRESVMEEKYWQFIRMSVWMNTLSWTIIFSVASWELKSTGPHYIAAATLVVGFATASLITLSYDKWLFFPFNIFLLGAPTLIAFINGYYIIPLIFIFSFLYQCRQYREYRTVIEHRFGTQVDLEDSNEALKESKEDLINKTVQLVHASKSAALGEMAGGLSHEVNNSLMVILGTIRQMERKMKINAHDDPEYDKKIGRMIESIQKITSIIDGLKYFSLEHDQVPREFVSLKQIMERTLNYSQEMLKAHSIELTVDEIPDVTISCHPMELTQAMFSILKNADEALVNLKSPADRWIKIRFGRGHKKVLIKIINGGPMIPKEIREKVFQPFFTTKDVGEGTGLSLSIAKGILREHGGDLTIEEGESKTCFLLELPHTQI